jgi:hypothetical protein
LKRRTKKMMIKKSKEEEKREKKRRRKREKKREKETCHREYGHRNTAGIQQSSPKLKMSAARSQTLGDYPDSHMGLCPRL